MHYGYSSFVRVVLPQVDAAASGPADPTKFVGKKSKAQAKKGAGATQWEILLKSGIPPEEIPRFR